MDNRYFDKSNTQEKIVKPHKISIDKRKCIEISGVNDCISFDPNMVCLETSEGTLNIKGKNLTVGNLSIDKGEISISGKVDSLVYSDTVISKKSSLFGKLLG